jgi:hypothetical protein
MLVKGYRSTKADYKPAHRFHRFRASGGSGQLRLRVRFTYFFKLAADQTPATAPQRCPSQEIGPA